MARPNFVEKTFAGGSKTVKFVKDFSLKFSAIRYMICQIISFFYSWTIEFDSEDEKDTNIIMSILYHI